MSAKISKTMYEAIKDNPAKAEILDNIIRHQLYGEPLDERVPKSDKRAVTSVANGRMGGRPRGSVSAHHAPEIAEIRRFIAEEHLKVCAEDFYHYYQATGWKTGDEPIRSWKALARKWDESRDIGKMSKEELLNALKA